MFFFHFFVVLVILWLLYITREELDKILLWKIEPIETSLNFNGHEFKKLLSRVDTLKKTVKALQLENQALKPQINYVNTMVKENDCNISQHFKWWCPSAGTV